MYYNNSTAPWSRQDGGAVPPNTAAPVVDVTFVDDSAFFVTDRNACALVSNVARVIDVIVCVFRMFGLIPD